MKAIQLTAPSLAAFRPTELPQPQAGRGEVLLRLRAATLNFLDVAIATGNFAGAAFPLIPVADGAGEVAALGDGVSGLTVGDRVIPHFMPNWQGGAITPHNVGAMRGVTLPGSLAEYVVVPAASLVALPAHLDFVQGAALPIAATTAWNAVRSAPGRPGSVVLLLGTGGVSLFALQFAKASGATVILASSSDDKLERARQLGADHLINYRATPAWDGEVLKLTGGRGADLVVETVGGAPPSCARSMRRRWAARSSPWALSAARPPASTCCPSSSRLCASSATIPVAWRTWPRRRMPSPRMASRPEPGKPGLAR